MASLSRAKTKSVPYAAQLLSSLLGVALSVYLLVQHTRLKSGIQDSASFCSLGRLADCDVVNASQYSEFLGFPLASLGAIYFFLLFLLGVLARPSDPGFRSIQNKVAWLAALGIVADMLLLFVQLGILQTVCVICLATDLVVLLIFATVIWLYEPSEAPLADKLRSLFTPKQTGGRVEFPTQTLALALTCMVLFILVITLLPAGIRMKGQTYAYVNNAIEQFYAQWKDKTSQKIDFKETDGTMGDPSAKIRIVEFSDFECPHCQKAAFTLKTALKPMEKTVFFVYKHYPLDSACNPSIVYQLHPNSCRLAQLAYCAGKKGKFWEYHDRIFFSRDPAKLGNDFGALTTTLKGIFAEDEITKCLANEKPLQNVTEDIRLGNSINIRGTPAVFINGKQVTIPVTVETIRKLIQLEAGGG